ncbi:chain-length determining protein [Brevundimonas variabilis]|uniref:BexC/CtrB/KpsE family polysaccharide export inner-membrane protein n=1 Tax=Brevundimonas variabilis TaxID=74312 RepID=A0A7W9CGU7_9CAUL|nr:chain-length determining protein [Brevundimonas variabilis]MBB5745339.1 BexC/CtrB/KpsE family polysaccharide export inner-membrane protein [Brevundimonas variabilis]
MTEAKLNYVGPIPKALTFERAKPPLWRRLPLGFLILVLLPTVVAAVYYLLIASPRYVSEARFLVRAPNQNVPSSLGVALQGVGISSGQTDAFAVHEYISSRDGLKALTQRYDVEAMLAPPGADFLSRYPRPGEADTFEGLYKAFQRFLTVGYDSTTGLSTLRVEAFSARDAQAMAEALLSSGESLVNRLNERSNTDAVANARLSQEEARTRLSEAQLQLAAFRNREEFIDPTLAAREGSALIGGLLSTVAQLQAERAQVAADAPSSPQLPTIDSRIAAYQQQIATERAKIAGGQESLAPRIGAYEDLVAQREFALAELENASAALLVAQQEGRRQSLYLERVVSPSLPDEAEEPHRWLAILTVFATMMLIYGVGWLIWAGVQEHRQV